MSDENVRYDDDDDVQGYGDASGDDNAPADESSTSMRSEMVQTYIATDYAHVIGHATFTEALESLQAAME
jgi:hypothetical protein